MIYLLLKRFFQNVGTHSILHLTSSESTAYSAVIDAFRASGPLTDEKRAVLSDLGGLLGVGVERQQAEVRRALSDELLATVALRLSGADLSSSWEREGRRVLPLLPRAAPHTALTSLAARAGAELRVQNAQLPPPDQTRTLVPPSLPPPSSPPPKPLSTEHFAQPEPVPKQNGLTKREAEAENGFVILPSGMAVRVREESPPAGRRGKRKRSASKSIEVFPDGIPTSRTTSVLGAGHGYARPAPSQLPEPPLSPSRRGPGQTSAPSPPLLTPPMSQARGRPRLLGAGPRARPPRPRLPRPPLLLTPQPTLPSPLPPLLFSSQTTGVQVPMAAPPRPTTIQLKQDMNPTSSLQGLKVISHSTTKVLPKPGVSAVYMLPPAPRMAAAPHRLLGVSTAPPRLLPPSPGLPTGVIRTVRARQPGMITNAKPSVIVVQKGGGPSMQGCLRTTRPATVSLYRPRPLAPGIPRLAGQNDSGNLILVDLAQAQDSSTLSSLFSASGVLPDPGGESGAGQRKIFLQRPGNQAPTTTTWGETSTPPSSDPPISQEASHPPGRLVTLPPRSISTPQESPVPSPPSLEVVPGRQHQANGEA